MSYARPHAISTTARSLYSPPYSPHTTTPPSSKSKIAKQLKWMPKTPTGDPTRTYSRTLLLHCLQSGVSNTGSASTRSTENALPNVALETLVQKLKTAPREDSPRHKKKHKAEEFLPQENLEVKKGEGVGETKGHVGYDDSWCSTQVYSGVDSPELGCQPSDLSEQNECWDMYTGLDGYEQEYAWPVTSLVLFNVPIKYVPLDMVQAIKSHKFGKDLNFLYLPRDPSDDSVNWGMCTVNFSSQEAAQQCFDYYNNSKCFKVLRRHPSTRTVKVFPSRMQGLEWNLEELRRDPVLEKLEEDSKWRPFLFENGKPMPFTVTRRPAKRHSGDGDSQSRKSRHPSEQVDPDVHTTIMMRNIPNKYTRAMLHSRLKESFGPTDYNFIYMPIDFINKCNVGYAFLNFRNKEGVEKAITLFHNVECQKALPGFNSQKIVELTPARVQGLEKNIEHLQNSDVLNYTHDHSDWTPLVFNDEGKILPFPIHGSITYSNALPVRPHRARKRSRASTTIMVKNLPSECTRDQFIDMMNTAGLKGEYDFLYFPFDSINEAHDGTAHVNFRSGAAASKFSGHLKGKKREDLFMFSTRTELAAGVEVFRMATDDTMEPPAVEACSAPLQGLDKNISSVKEALLIADMKDFPEWAPLIFDINGDRLAFPENISLRADAAPFTPPLRADAAPFTPPLHAGAAPFILEVDPLTSPTTSVKTITEQMEYLFSEENLSRDVFLRSHMDDEGWVPMEVFMRFPALVKLGVTPDLVSASAVESEVIEIKYGKVGAAVRIHQGLRDTWIQSNKTK